MRKCRFCALSAKEESCHKVYEDKSAFVFMDKTPVNNGHVLAIPKKHVPNFEDLDEKTYLHLMRLVRKLSKAVKTITQCKKVGILIAGFDVAHTHIHIIPMKEIRDAATRRVWEEGWKPAPFSTLEKMAKTISKEIKTTNVTGKE